MGMSKILGFIAPGTRLRDLAGCLGCFLFPKAKNTPFIIICSKTAT
jgi:hypothetical protein